MMCTSKVGSKGGEQGRDVSEQEGGRMARTRGVSERGRGTCAGDRPLVVSWVERGGEGRVFELRRSAGKKSLLSSALSHVEKDSQVDTSREGELPAFGRSLPAPERETQRRIRSREPLASPAEEATTLQPIRIPQDLERGGSNGAYPSSTHQCYKCPQDRRKVVDLLGHGQRKKRPGARPNHK